MIKPFIVVLGNTKGGTGKSTLAIHLSTALLYRDFSVTCIDLDGGQGTLSRYLENRSLYNHRENQDVPIPSSLRICTTFDQDWKDFQKILDDFILQSREDFIVIDTGGNDAPLSCYAHSLADVLMTPINDSLIDLDLLVNVGTNMPEHQLPLSTYASMVWTQRMEKMNQKKGTIEWIVLRNRMHSTVSNNRIHIARVLETLSKRIGFHLVSGVGERVIFRELFDVGLTLLDKQEKQTLLSHISARQEIRTIVDAVLRFYEKKHSPQSKNFSKNC